jgi:hypothetical protein
LFRSRDSPFPPLSTPIFQADAALCVQNGVVVQKGTPYMVFSCLTPVQFRRYSSSNLCATSPAKGEGFSEGTLWESNWSTWIEQQVPRLRIPIRERIGTLRSGRQGSDWYRQGVTVAQTEKAPDSRFQIFL